VSGPADDTGMTVPEIDTSVAHEARMYDYLLGGVVNFAVDRAAAEAQAAATGGMDNARTAVRAIRDFMGRAVRYLAGEAGVRQFLDIGTGIPGDDHVHRVAQDIAPGSRVVYVDYDPIVLAHAHELLTSSPEGATAYLQADLRRPETILEEAAATLDLDEPVALLLMSILHFLDDDEDPYGLVSRYVSALAPGSYLGISHMTADIQPEAMRRLAAQVAANPDAAYRFTMRSHPEVARFFDGLEMVPPGLVPVDEWRVDSPITYPDGVGKPPSLGGVGRRP
jgi:hypothetical protein